VLFVHAFAGSSGQWSAQLAHLRTTRRAIALDLRGHGQSAAPGNLDYRVESLAKDVLRVADALDVKRFVLVGHSLGGAVAASVVNAQPDRVAGLVLVATPGKVPAEQAADILARIESDYNLVMKEHWTRLLEGAQPNVRARVHNDMARVSKDAALEMIEATFEFDPLPGLLKYQGPKLAIVTTPGETPYDLHKLAPDLPHVLIEGTSHWPQMDKPVEFNRVLDEFLLRVK
jgi:pimeloyl-ACP methyl ester carboxylesterase